MKAIISFSTLLWLFILLRLSASADLPFFNDTPPARVEIPSERMRHWDLDYGNYVGTRWRTPCYWDECDPPFSDYKFKPSFNEIDGKVDRRRAKTDCGRPTYLVKNELPLNPEGRTGYSGRGVLPRWGPNHLVRIFVIWKKQGKIATLWRNGSNRPFEGFVDHVSNGYPSWIKKVFDTSLRHAHVSEPLRKELLHRSEKTLKKMFSGSMPHGWNTDNAWVEYHYYYLPCHKNEKLCSALAADKSEQNGWTFDFSLPTVDRLIKKLRRGVENRAHPQQYSAFCEPELPLSKLFKHCGIGDCS